MYSLWARLLTNAKTPIKTRPLWWKMPYPDVYANSVRKSCSRGHRLGSFSVIQGKYVAASGSMSARAGICVC